MRLSSPLIKNEKDLMTEDAMEMPDNMDQRQMNSTGLKKEFKP